MDIMGLKTEDLDVVYCVKGLITNEELRYSLRSLRNLPHRKVWIFGGCPEWVNTEEVNFVPMEQTGNTKWKKSNSSVKRACETEGVSEDFILFNDDFFVMQPIDELETYYHKDLGYRVREIMTRGDVWGFSGYCRRLMDESRMLKYMGKPTLNYAVHIPMVFNKKKMLKLFEKYPDRVISRALYGNYYEVGGVDTDDVKIYLLNEKPDKDSIFLSSTNDSFARGEVGKYIRRKFKKASEYEKGE